MKNIGDCEVELRICFKSVPQVLELDKYYIGVL